MGLTPARNDELEQLEDLRGDPSVGLAAGLATGSAAGLATGSADVLDTVPADAPVSVLELAAPPPLDMRNVLFTAVLVMMGFTAFALVLGWLFQEPLLATGEWFVARFGGVGIAVGFYFPDAFTMPVPNDAFTAFGLWGGMPFARVVAWGSLGSLLGGSTGWVIGRHLLARSAGLQAYIKRRGGDEMTAHLRRGGRWFLAIAAVSPVPYSVTCWAAGATKMPYLEFLTISLLRVPRIAAFLWLIQQGFVSVAG